MQPISLIISFCASIEMTQIKQRSLSSEGRGKEAEEREKRRLQAEACEAHLFAVDLAKTSEWSVEATLLKGSTDNRHGERR